MSEWPGSLRSSRLAVSLALSSLQPADLALERRPDWLAEAERAVLGADPGCPLSQRVDPGDVAYWIRIRRDGNATPVSVGACAARLERQDLVWRWLAVGEPWRAFGYGGAAVPLVERAARSRGAQGARVRVPATNGVALYFWLRLGYRPAAPSAEAASQWREPYPGTWMSRLL